MTNSKNAQNRNNDAKLAPFKNVAFVFNIIFRVLQSVIAFGAILLFLGGALGAGIGLGYFAYLVQDTEPPTREEFQKQLGDITEISHMAYEDGAVFSTIRSDLIRTRVNSDEISPWLKKAIISTEDEYFEEHHGVVPKAVIRALVSEATGIGGASGGSTLTQQLVKQQVLTNETTFKRKATEILLAYRLENYFSKDEIVTTYLNVSPFGRNNKGENIAGVQEAAQGIFGRNANDLTLPQAAFIAGLPQSPIVYAPYTNTGELKEDLSLGLKRKDYVLFCMYREKVITEAEYEEAKSYDLTQDFKPTEAANQNSEGFLYYTVYEAAVEAIAETNIKKAQLNSETIEDASYKHYKEQAERELQNRGYTVYSTINQDVYNAMQQAVANYGYLLDEGYAASYVETGSVLMDNQTGRIIGFVGGRNYDINQNNHAFDTERQIGSTIKPLLVYGPAIDQGMIGSESRLANYPTSYENNGGKLENATNAGTNTFDTVRHALAWSYNIPVYHLNQAMNKQTGDEAFGYNHYLKKMNYPASDTWGYQSAPLGTVETNVLTQTNGFQTLANGGKYQKGYLIDKIVDSDGAVIYQHEDEPVQVYSEAAASIMNDLMRTVLDSKYTTQFTSVISGLNGNLGSADWVGKTGTTDEFRDAWLIVSTPTVTLSSWTGYDEGALRMSNDSGNKNTNYLANLANAVYAVRPDLFGVEQKFTLSSDVIQSKVASFTGQKPGSFNYNGGTYTISDNSVTSFYAKNGAPASQYKFGYGGTDENYAAYWGDLTKSTTKTDTNTNNNNSSNNNNNNQSNTTTNNNNSTDKKDGDDNKED